MVDTQVGSNAIQPSAEASLSTVGPARTVDAEKNFLREFLGDRLVVHHAEHEVHDRLAVLADQNVKGAHIAGAQLEHDLGVSKLGVVSAGDGGGTGSGLGGCQLGAEFRFLVSIAGSGNSGCGRDSWVGAGEAG